MGAGLAKAIADLYQTAPGVFGVMFKSSGPGVYRATCSKHDGTTASLISFPTKVLWREPAIWEVTRRSITQLVALVDSQGLDRVYVPKVGCGLGGLDWKMVSEVLEEMLDERFTIPY